MFQTIVVTLGVALLAPAATAACDHHSWTLLHSAWLRSYEDSIDGSIKERGPITTSDATEVDAYQQVYFECGTNNGIGVQRVINLGESYTTARIFDRVSITDRFYYSKDQNSPRPAGFGDSKGNWAEQHGFGSGVRRFIIRRSQIHCALNYGSVEGGQSNNPSLGQYGRVWVRKSTDKPAEDELPTCLPAPTTTTATTTTNAKIEGLFDRMTETEKIIEDQIKVILPQLADLTSELKELRQANVDLKDSKEVLEVRVTELEDGVASDTKKQADRITALEAAVFDKTTTTTTTTTTTRKPQATTLKFDGDARKQCSGSTNADKCAPVVSATSDGGLELVSCCGDVVVHGQTCSADVCDLDERIAALEDVVGL